MKNCLVIIDVQKGFLNEYTAFIPQRIKELCIKRKFDVVVSTKFINKFEKLVLVGIDTDCCVLKSASDCFDKKIPFEVVLDCCASSSGEEYHRAASLIMKRNFGSDFIH